MQLVATILERTHAERSLNIYRESSHNAQFSQNYSMRKQVSNTGTAIHDYVTIKLVCINN